MAVLADFMVVCAIQTITGWPVGPNSTLVHQEEARCGAPMASPILGPLGRHGPRQCMFPILPIL